MLIRPVPDLGAVRSSSDRRPRQRRQNTHRLCRAGLIAPSEAPTIDSAAALITLIPPVDRPPAAQHDNAQQHPDRTQELFPALAARAVSGARAFAAGRLAILFL